MDKNEIVKLLGKSDLVKYCYSGLNVWNATYLADDIDRMSAFAGITEGGYNLRQKVYLYRSIRNQFKLIAVISERSVKLC